jgi:hypothetical protein
MVFVEAYTFDVVPRSRLMAKKALIHLGLLLVCDAHRNHFEVHHVMARWGLMTLRARLRGRGGVSKIRESPFRGGVALRTVVAEQPAVPVFGGVAARAI